MPSLRTVGTGEYPDLYITDSKVQSIHLDNLVFVAQLVRLTGHSQLTTFTFPKLRRGALWIAQNPALPECFVDETIAQLKAASEDITSYNVGANRTGCLCDVVDDTIVATCPH